MKSNEDKKIKYMSFGSPLMDIIGDVDPEFIKANEIDLNSTVHKKLGDIPFITDFLTTSRELTYVPGGCQFNAMRVFNWMLDKDEDDVVGFLGSIGDDENFGNIYLDKLISEDIVPVFEQISGQTTGLCLVVCCNRDRAHLTDLGASTAISKEYVERNWNKFKDVKLIYTELFIIKSQRDLCYKIAGLGLKDSIIYGFNLPAVFFLQNFLDDILKLCGYADIIFCNSAEATTLITLMGVLCSGIMREIAEEIVKIPKKNKNKKRIVVITSGPDPAAVCEYDHKTQKVTFYGEFNVRNVCQENIVDTNGAGDAFAGGFLSQYMKGKSISECMYAGHWAASYIIRQRGMQFDAAEKYCPNKDKEEDEKDEDKNGK